MSANLSLSNVFNPRAGWYRGDFHAHTNFSDGYHAPPDLVNVARAGELDFFTITDHNTVAAYPGFGDVPDVLIIPGIEMTMDEGHYNVFGLAGRFDWLPDVCLWPRPITFPAGQFDSLAGLMQRAAGEGLLNSINHPLLPPWAWLDNRTDLRHIHCLEIWNDPSWPDNRRANPQAVDMWTRWLNAGYRITAIGGSDYHRPQPAPGQNKPPERLGVPATWVYAEELSGAAILAGVRRRQVYVSMGPQVTFRATAGGDRWDIGADLGEMDGEIEFEATVLHAEPVQARLIKNGEVVARASLEAGGGALRHRERAAPGVSAWYRLDVLDANRQILAVTNPVFVGPPVEPSRFTYGELVEAPDGAEQ